MDKINLVDIQRLVLDNLELINSTKYDLNEILDTDLFEGKFLDSFAVLELITNLEKDFSTQIPVQDLSLENFSTVNSISKYLLSKI